MASLKESFAAYALGWMGKIRLPAGTNFLYRNDLAGWVIHDDASDYSAVHTMRQSKPGLPTQPVIWRVSVLVLVTIAALPAACGAFVALCFHAASTADRHFVHGRWITECGDLEIESLPATVNDAARYRTCRRTRR